jgi:hypothetical protein
MRAILPDDSPPITIFGGIILSGIGCSFCFAQDER